MRVNGVPMCEGMQSCERAAAYAAATTRQPVLYACSRVCAHAHHVRVSAVLPATSAATSAHGAAKLVALAALALVAVDNGACADTRGFAGGFTHTGRHTTAKTKQKQVIPPKI